MDLHLADKVVLVTGSSRGIGLATAQAFAAEGCRLMMSARTPEALRDAAAAVGADGSRVASHVADVTKPDDAARLVEATVAAFGGIDVLVNNVGGGGGGRAIADSTDEEWRSTLEVNLLQTVRMMRLALPHMRDRAGAAVVNISSISGWSPQLAGTGEHRIARLHPRRRQWLGSLSPGEPGELRRLRAARISDGPSRQSRRGRRCGRVPGVAAGALDQRQEHSGGWARAAIRRTRPASVLRSARPLW
jgi:NAD(P)-dependent dehydrogenase (short-subunit alcohol dehydrogenase family)